MDLYDRLNIPAEERTVSIAREEAEYLYRFLRRRKVRRTVETGFAFGCSTAHIMAATGAPHVAIDPFQQHYDDRGLKNIERLGYAENLWFMEEPSQTALPQLDREEVRFDFAFVDGSHRFDDIFVDWFYLDRMLEPGGHIFFHDTWLRPIRMVASFIRTNRTDYRRIPAPRESFFAFRKIGKDLRSWDHYRNFCP
ncbi:MAG: class I SAM-dependent methyltransferase [Candidatus Peribacteraceae bacterium]|nr:class I SAM-dependent methyltransferase [Candidatus Peribacteraceae bacterium]